MQLRDLITSPMGLGEEAMRWIPLKVWLKPPFERRLTGIAYEDFWFEVIEISEPEVKILIKRFKFD